MAKIVTTDVVIRVSKLTKDGADASSLIPKDFVEHLEGVVTELLSDDTLVVEIVVEG